MLCFYVLRAEVEGYTLAATAKHSQVSKLSCCRSMNDPEYIPAESSEKFETGDDYIESDDDDDDDASEYYYTLSSEKKYPCDEQVFLVYESQLVKLLNFCMKCGSVMIYRREMKNTGSQLTLMLKCSKGEKCDKVNIFFL